MSRSKVTELKDEVRQLKEQLAKKDEELSRSIKRCQEGKMSHVDTLKELNQTRAELKMSQEKCTDLEKKLQKGSNDSHQSPDHGDHVRGQESEKVEALNKELFKREQALRLQFLEEEQQMRACMRLRLVCMQEEFCEKLLEEREKWRREMSEREERLRQRLERGRREEKNNPLKKKLSTFMGQWQTEAQQWKKQQSELKEKLQQEDEGKQETEHFQEQFQQLLNNNEKKEDTKKKKKGLWNNKLKFWKK